MIEYGFKKLEPSNIASNLYTCNYCGYGIEGKFYRKEDVIILLGTFISTFPRIKESIQEMEEIFKSLIKT